MHACFNNYLYRIDKRAKIVHTLTLIMREMMIRGTRAQVGGVKV